MAGPPATGGIIHGGKSGGGKKGPAMAGPGVPASSPLLDPSSSLSGQDLYAAAKALADAQVSGPYSELARQIAANQQQTTNAEKLTGGYFNQFGQQAQQGYKDEGQIADQLSSQLAGIGQGTQQQLAGLGQGAQASLSKYTPGADASLANPAMQSLTAEIARQQGLAAQSSGIQQGAGAIQGANYRGLAAANVGTGALAGQETLGDIARAGQLKNEPLTAKQAGLLAGKGALIASDIGKLRQQEITNRITTAGLGIDQARIAASVANAATTQRGENSRFTAGQRAATQRTRITQRGENSRFAAGQRGENQRSAAAIAARAAAAAAKNSGTGGTKPLTTNEQNPLFNAIGEMQALIKQGTQAGHSHGSISQSLQTGTLIKGFPAQKLPLINAAFELVNYGFVWPQTAQALRQMGLRPEQHGLRVQAPTAAQRAAQAVVQSTTGG